MEQHAKLESLEQATALGPRAGDGDGDKSLSGKFFSSSGMVQAECFHLWRSGEFFHVPFRHLDVNNTTWLPLLMLQWPSEGGSWPYWEMRSWMSGREITGILLAHVCAAVNKRIVGWHSLGYYIIILTPC